LIFCDGNDISVTRKGMQKRVVEEKMKALLPSERVERTILLIRGHKVMLDTDLADLYGVTTKRLNEQVKRNRNRFPVDFMFQLTSKEKAEVVANCDHLTKLKFSPAKPFAFTEHGAVMVASVLNSKRAIEVSVYVVRAFVKVREVLGAHSELAQKLTELERRVESHDTHIRSLFDAIRQLMEPTAIKSRRIGFKT
jgi:ORF6N domain